MRKLLAVIMLLALIFGCVGESSQPANVTTGNISGVSQNASSPTLPSLGCSAKYTIEEPKNTTLGGSATLGIKAECAEGKTIQVLVDGASAGKSTVPADPSVLNFKLSASSEGTKKITVESDNSTIHSTSWSISPIGFTDTSGVDNDIISISQMKAIAFNISDRATIRNVQLYLRRLQSLTLESNIVLQIMSDSSGEPGSLVSSTSVPIEKATMTPNWIDFPVNATLTKGRYWLVLSVDKDNDNVNINYIGDKTSKGNGDHLMMALVKNRDTEEWEETEWEKLPFDKQYTFIVSSVAPQ